MPFTMAGQPQVSPKSALDILRAYPKRTVPRYDLGIGYAHGNANSLVVDDLRRTQVINSRIPRSTYPNWLDRASTAPWTGLRPHATLGDPNMATFSAALKGAKDLYYHFFDQPGMKRSTVSKVLHLKRPGFYPILDRRASRLYLPLARTRMQAEGINETPAMWLCVRDDLLRPSNQRGIESLRRRAASDPTLVNILSLTDLRILDILMWSLS